MRSRRRLALAAPIAVVIVALIAVSAMAFRNELDTPEPVDPIDPDPLATSEIGVDDSIFEGPGKAQQESAIAAALAEPSVSGELAGKRYRGIYAEWYERESKQGASTCDARRCIEVIFYIYTNNRLLHAFIDSDSWTFIGKAHGTGQPPLSEEEREVAHLLAESDATVLEKTQGLTHDHGQLAAPLYPHSGPCEQDRCASVIFHIGDSLRTGEGRRIIVLVDLTTETVLERDFHWCYNEEDHRDCSYSW